MPAPNPGASTPPEALATALHRASTARLALAHAMLAYCRLLAELPAPVQAALGKLHRDVPDAIETGRAIRHLDQTQLDALAGALHQPTDHAEIRRRAAKLPRERSDDADVSPIELLAAGLIGPAPPRRSGGTA